MTIRTTIEKRQCEQTADEQTRNDHRRHRLERTWEVLQQLEEAEEVPLGTRHVAGVRRVSHGVQWRRHLDGQRDEQREHAGRDQRVLQRVIRVERPRAARWDGRSGPEMPCRRMSARWAADERDQGCRQQKDMRRVPAQQRQRAECIAASQDAGDVTRRTGRHGPTLMVTVVAQYAF